MQQSLAQIGDQGDDPAAARRERSRRACRSTSSAFFFFNNWISINNDPFYHLYWLFRSDCCNYTNYDNQTV